MIRHDVTGYGMSMYWHNQMREIAQENLEMCSCWLTHEPLIKFNGMNKFTISIECSEKMSECRPYFKSTEKEFTERFKSFYNI